MEHTTEVRGEAVHVCARILLKYTLNIDEENKVINAMPKWEPGKHKGEAVSVKYTVPVAFKL